MATRRKAVVVLATGCVGIAVAVLVYPQWRKRQEFRERDACWKNLVAVDGAKQSWCLAENATRPPTWAELDSWIVGGYRSLKCPAGGEYEINGFRWPGPYESPTCTFHGDLLAIRPAGSAPTPGWRR